jgi:hypothetical protein
MHFSIGRHGIEILFGKSVYVLIGPRFCLDVHRRGKRCFMLPNKGEH